MNIFNMLDYKEIIKKNVEIKKKHDSKINFNNMSQYMRIQKPYLSKVINQRAELNSDQLFLACEYLNFNEEETSFIFLLHEYQRSVVQKRKEILLGEIKKIQKQKLDTFEHIEKKSVGGEASDEIQQFFLNPYLQIIHIALSIEKYRKAPDELAQDLNIPKQMLNNSLQALIDLELVDYVDEEYKVVERNFHLSKKSFICTPNQQLLRLAAMNQLQKGDPEEQYTLAVTFSADEKTRKEIQTRFLKLLKSVEKDVKSAPCDNVYQMNFELFSWT